MHFDCLSPAQYLSIIVICFPFIDLMHLDFEVMSWRLVANQIVYEERFGKFSNGHLNWWICKFPLHCDLCCDFRLLDIIPSEVGGVQIASLFNRYDKE